MAICKLFELQKELMAIKYYDNVAGISKKNNVDMGVAFDMLLANYDAMCKGQYSEIKPGGGILNYAELGTDINQLDKYRRK